MENETVLYINKLIQDDEYVSKLNIYTSLYLSIEKSLPKGFKLIVTKKIAKFFEIHKELILLELKIQHINAEGRGEIDGN